MIINLGNVVGLIKSELPPLKTYVIWFKWENYPITPEEGDLYHYDHDDNTWKLFTTGGGSGDVSYIKTEPIKINLGPLIKDAYIPDGTIQNLLDDLFYPFIPPTITFNIGGQPFEKGLNITNVPLNFLVTPNDGLIALRSILKNLSVINNPSINSGTYNYMGGLSFGDSLADRTFKFKVDFSNNASLELSASASFVAPSYHGVLPFASINETNIKTLTKNIWPKSDRLNLSFSPTLQRIVYAYPKSYGLLGSIIDPNNFSVLPEFTVTELSFLLADGVTNEDYYVYYNNDNTTQINFLLDFKF